MPLIAALADPTPPVTVRVGTHEGYGRVVFDLPAHTGYHLTQQGQHVVIQFGGDLTIGSAPRVPHNVLSITGGAGQAELDIAPGTVVRDSRLGDRVVIDVWDAGAASLAHVSQVMTTGSAPPTAAQPKGMPAPNPPTPKPPTQASPAALSPPPAAKPADAVAPPRAVAVPASPPSQALAQQTPPADTSPAPSSAANPPISAAVPEQAPAPPAALAAEPSDQAAAKPDGTLVVQTDGQLGIAVFRHGGVALIVFDQPQDIDTAPLRDDPVFGAATVRKLSTATVVRVPLDPSMALSVEHDAHDWSVAAVTIEPKLQPIASSVSGDALMLAATAPGNVVSIADPDTGATLLVGTQRREGQGVPVERQSAEFTLFATWQGVAVEPNADTLSLRPTDRGFVLSNGIGGLAISPPSDITEQLARSAGLTRDFDFPSQSPALLMQRLQRQIGDDAATPALARGPRRVDVARTMISLGLGVEAQAVLRVAAADDPQQAGSPDNAGLASIAALVAQRPDEAIGLNDPKLTGADDLALWRAIRLAELREDSPQAAAMLAATLPLLLAYPAEMRDRLLPLVAQTLIAGGESHTAAALLEARQDDASLDLARGMLREAQGDAAGALTIYDRLARSGDPLQSARASVRAVELRLANGTFSVRQAADELDKQLYAWRGDAHERALRERVAELKARSGQWRSALSLLRETEALFPDAKAAIHGELQAMFTRFLREDRTETLPPLELVSLVEENTDLLPSGAEGEALQARLADKLLALDLPKRAAPVLEKLMQVAPTKTGGASFGARLAALRLRDGDTAGALAALSASDAATLPADLVERRTLLMAAADAQRGDNEHALAALGKLNTPSANEARATILERENDWPAAQRALTEYAAKVIPPDGKLNDAQRQILLRLATATARSGDDAALAALRQKEGPRMQSGPLADMFRLLTAAEVRSVADLRRSGQEAALARALPADLKALQPPSVQTQ